MNKTQEKMLKRMLKSIDEIKLALNDFENDCEKKMLSNIRPAGQKEDFKDFVKLSCLASRELSSAKSQIEAMLNY